MEDSGQLSACSSLLVRVGGARAYLSGKRLIKLDHSCAAGWSRRSSVAVCWGPSGPEWAPSRRRVFPDVCQRLAPAPFYPCPSAPLLGAALVPQARWATPVLVDAPCAFRGLTCSLVPGLGLCPGDIPSVQSNVPTRKTAQSHTHSMLPGGVFVCMEAPGPE